MKANALKYRLKIYKKENQENEFLEKMPQTCVFVKEVFAGCKNLSNESKALNDGENLELICEFTLRFLELDFSYFLVFEKRAFEILSINWDKDKRFLNLKARSLNDN